MKVTVVHCVGFGKTLEDCEPLFNVYESLGLNTQAFIPPWEEWKNPNVKSLTMVELAIYMAEVAMWHSGPGKKVLLTGHSTGGNIASNATSHLENLHWPSPPDSRLAVYSTSPFPDGRIERAYLNPASDTQEMNDGVRRDLGRSMLNPVYSPALTFCGSQEKDYVQEMWQDTARIWEQVEPYMPECGHDVNHPAYLDMIRRHLPEVLEQEREYPLHGRGFDPNCGIAPDSVMIAGGPTWHKLVPGAT